MSLIAGSTIRVLADKCLIVSTGKHGNCYLKTKPALLYLPELPKMYANTLALRSIFSLKFMYS